ncbi:MAG: DNA polymerase ligase N-terminal domain-containing protein [Acidimicrobiales bacterium]
MADALDRYRAKRDFARTSEPSGEGAPATAHGDRFVVQEHHATSMHWDLRLERDGVLASWAVPKGIPADPREDHLAVQTEDHPLSYLDFHGVIPEGEYGGGAMVVWDQGRYECHKWEDGEIMITLHGRRAEGLHVLFRTGERQWMLHRMDPAQDPGRQLMPSDLRPVVATRGPLPDDEAAWSFEAAMGGATVLVASQGGRARVTGGDGRDVSSRFPELRPLGRALGAVSVILEGELVVTGVDGRPDPDLLARRSVATGEAAARRLAARHPAMFLADDVVWLEGHPTGALGYAERRELMDALDLSGPAWRTAPSHPGEGTALLAASRAQGLAGVRGRRLAGGYEPKAVRFTPA